MSQLIAPYFRAAAPVTVTHAERPLHFHLSRGKRSARCHAPACEVGAETCSELSPQLRRDGGERVVSSPPPGWVGEASQVRAGC